MTLALLLCSVVLEPAPEAEAPAPAPAPTPEAEAPAPAPAPEPAAADPAEAPTPAEPPPRVGAEAPLPDAPPRVEPSRLETTAWRGQGFFQIHVGAVIPAGGTPPARGSVVSVGGGLQLGWRLHPMVALGTGLTTFLHNHGVQDAIDSEGRSVEVQDFGRMTLFDPLFVRLYVPTRRRIEPRFDVGAVLGSYRAPFSDRGRLAGGVRMGAGLDVWIGPGFSLDFGIDPRLIIVGANAGVSLQAGMGATVHW